MRKFRRLLIPVLVSLVIISACTLSKRQYRRGYHAEWIGKKTTGKATVSSNNGQGTDKKPPYYKPEHLSASANTDHYSDLHVVTSRFSLLADLTKKDSIRDCDIIVFLDGREESARVLLVGETEVRYRRCSNQQGPVYVRFKSDIFLIKYANGTSTVITSPSIVKQHDTENTNSVVAGGEGHDQALALALCIFAGVFGIHRFYLGYYGLGVLYLLTAGLCLVGVLVDVILISNGDLKPRRRRSSSGEDRQGEYSRKL